MEISYLEKALLLKRNRAVQEAFDKYLKERREKERMDSIYSSSEVEETIDLVSQFDGYKYNRYEMDYSVKSDMVFSSSDGKIVILYGESKTANSIFLEMHGTPHTDSILMFCYKNGAFNVKSTKWASYTTSFDTKEQLMDHVAEVISKL